MTSLTVNDPVTDLVLTVLIGRVTSLDQLVWLLCVRWVLAATSREERYDMVTTKMIVSQCECDWQSVSQSTNESINQSPSQSISQSISQSVTHCHVTCLARYTLPSLLLLTDGAGRGGIRSFTLSRYLASEKLVILCVGEKPRSTEHTQTHVTSRDSFVDTSSADSLTQQSVHSAHSQRKGTPRKCKV